MNYLVKCNSTTGEVYVLDCYLITYDHKSDETLLGLSFYGCSQDIDKRRDTVYQKVPTNKHEIDAKKCRPYNRTGRLCGACRENYYPLAYSYKLHCVPCTHSENRYNWLNYMARAFIPLTLFYMFVILFKFNAHHPSIHVCILFSQLSSSSVLLRVVYRDMRDLKSASTAMNIITTLYGVWNLDFFRTIYPCLLYTSPSPRDATLSRMPSSA